ncbi:hypothetical protein CRN45_00490 [Vibrio vulnificus]|nr:hypothetical protein CRN45_00490 [Vibrio vulnificus]
MNWSHHRVLKVGYNTVLRTLKNSHRSK